MRVAQIRKSFLFLLAAMPGVAGAASPDGEQITVTMNAVTATGIGESLGQIVISKIAHGVLLTPTLTGLPPGPHGFHVHEVPDCSSGMDETGKTVAAHAAGEHLDPEGNDRHSSPLVGDGHLGDLPVLVVDVNGQASTPVEASRLTLEDLDNRALMIHAGGDNYSDAPEENGGGGERIACGIIDSLAEQTAADPQLRIQPPQ